MKKKIVEVENDGSFLPQCINFRVRRKDVKEDMMLKNIKTLLIC